MPQTILCSRCGKGLAPHASACPRCGKSLKQSGIHPLGLLLMAFTLCVVGLFMWGLYSNRTDAGSQARSAATTAAVESKPASVAAASAGPLPVFNPGLSVEEAYAAIPHRRTVMDFTNAAIPAADKEYLRRVFYLVDQFVALRVEAFQKFSRGDAGAMRLVEEMQRARNYLQTLEPPAHLGEYHTLMLQAFADERAFYQDWSEQGQAFRHGQANTIASHPKVQSASSAIHKAYDILMQKYAGEAPRNKEAIFDYHCALDFI